MRKYFEYMGVIVSPASMNASGIKWCAITDKGIVRADTKAGIKRLIRDGKGKA